MAWEIGLSGDPSELLNLAEAIRGPECMLIHRGAEFFLGGSMFDPMTDADVVRERARDLASSLSGASRLYLRARSKVEVGHVVRVDDAGVRNVTVFPGPAVIELWALAPSFSVTRADGTVDRCSPSAQVAAVALHSSESEVVRKVLRLRDRAELVWSDLTVIAEVIQSDGFQFTEANRADFERLTGSANHPDVAGDLARHGAPSRRAPPDHKRMTLSEARTYVDKLIRTWLDSKRQSSRMERQATN